MTDLIEAPDLLAEQIRPGGLPVDWSIDGPHLIVALRGEIDLSNAQALPDAVAAGLGTGTSVRVDIAEVTFLDSSLLRALLLCQARLAPSGIDIRVRNAAPQARRIFELANVASLLE
jgi:anti-anti-sigma factor